MDKIEIITSVDNFLLRKLVPLFVCSRLLVLFDKLLASLSIIFFGRRI